MDSTEYVLGKNWRDLIPVIKVDISTGKFIFGNRLLPTTLLITMEEAHFTYSTKPATCNLDHFMHTVKTKAENVKVVLAESPKYVGLRHDEAPRYMGDGFVVLASNTVNLYYYMDQAGRVPETQEMLCLASGEMVGDCEYGKLFVMTCPRLSLLLQFGVLTFSVVEEQTSATVPGPTGSGNFSTSSFSRQISNPWSLLSPLSLEICKFLTLK